MKKILEYWPLLTGCILYFGFCNLYLYYNEFNINILSFSNSSDVLLSLFPKAVVISTVIYGFLLQSIYTEIQKSETEKNQTNIPSEKKIKRLKWFRKNIALVMLIYYGFVITIKLSLIHLLNYKNYELIDYNIITNFLFLFLIYFAIVIGDSDKFLNENPILISFFIIVFIGNGIGNYRKNEAEKVKNGITEYKSDHITFKYNDIKIQTNKSLIFIGQTTDFLFLYNMKNKSSEIYKNDKIENLVIK